MRAESFQGAHHPHAARQHEASPARCDGPGLCRRRVQPRRLRHHQGDGRGRRGAQRAGDLPDLDQDHPVLEPQGNRLLGAHRGRGIAGAGRAPPRSLQGPRDDRGLRQGRLDLDHDRRLGAAVRARTSRCRKRVREIAEKYGVGMEAELGQIMGVEDDMHGRRGGLGADRSRGRQALLRRARPVGLRLRGRHRARVLPRRSGGRLRPHQARSTS